ncbi:SCO family protein [Aureimonas altamirensis]|uniref:SCO family protein n=1 Tax=Aureimonas altamirensis TaxID=370622 RepID=UPI0025553B62|nr:SCO family protein [Aureimonas altamirensis]MCM2505698.1 SCO family protein [Aureimonas altamirensis]
MKLRTVRIALWGAVAGVALMVVGAQFGWVGTTTGQQQPVAVAQDTVIPIGGEFELIDQTGKLRNWSDFRGKPVAVFFGFTHCPDICPMTLGELSVTLADLDADGGQGDDIQVLLITGDPVRDTPDILGRYLESFDPRIVGLTGSDDAIEKAFTVFRAYREIVPLEGDNYTVDHSAGVYLYDAEGAFFGTLDKDEPAEVRMTKIKRLLDGARGMAAGGA